MRIEAPRPILTFSAIGLAVLALCLQLIAGAFLGLGALAAAEWLAWGLYACAAVLLLAPLGRARAFLVGALAFMLTAWAVHLNARFSSHLAIQFGAAPLGAAQHVALTTLFIAPLVGLIVGVVTGLMARAETIRWRGRTYSS